MEMIYLLFAANCNYIRLYINNMVKFQQNIPILTVGSGQDLRQGDAAAVELAVRSEGNDHAASREPNIGGRPDAGGTGRAGAAILGCEFFFTNEKKILLC